MLFDSLDKLKRNSIMSAILLVVLGVIIMVCPVAHIPLLIQLLGYTLAVVAIVMILNFFSGNKSLMEYIKFFCALLLGIAGLIILVFQGDIMPVLAWISGLLLVLDGARTMFHAFTYARRSQRKGWWVLAVLSALLIMTGAIVFSYPWWGNDDMLMKVLGCAVFFAAMISAIRLFWTWPIRNDKGGNENGEA